MLRCTKIQLQVSVADAAALECMQGKCRGLSNWWGLRLRDGRERWLGWTEAQATREASKEYGPEPRFAYSKLLHKVYLQLDKAMVAFYRCGRPRHCYFTLCYPS